MNKRILLVEDDKFIYDLYKKVLTEAGFVIDIAADGEEGLNKILQGGNDLILLDIMLPKKNGIQILSDLKAANSRVPVMVLSNLGQDEVIRQCLSLGAIGYLVKVQNLPQDVVLRVKEYFGVQ